MTQEIRPTDFIREKEDLPSNSTFPVMELCLQTPKLPGHDTSHFSKLSWCAQANQKAFHVECNCQFAADTKNLTQLTREANLVITMWGRHAHLSEVVIRTQCLAKSRN
jgi:hypothetical protein